MVPYVWMVDNVEWRSVNITLAREQTGVVIGAEYGH